MTTQIAKYKRCEECNGCGGGHADYMNSDHNLERGTGEWEDCENCQGEGIEPDEDIIIERIIENLDIDQENKLQEYFINLKEFGGVAIIKDNCEDMFENWLGSVSLKTLEKVLYE